MPTIEVALATKVGNRLVGEIEDIWVPYVTDPDTGQLYDDSTVTNSEFRPEFWRRVNGQGYWREVDENRALPREWALEHQGHLVHLPQEGPTALTTRTRYTLAYAGELVNWTDGSVFWRWRPRSASDHGYGRFQLYDDDDFDPNIWFEYFIDNEPDGQHNLYAYIWPTNDYAEVTYSWDPTTEIWARIRHDNATETWYIEIAESGGSWTVLLSLQDIGADPPNNLEIEFLSEIRWLTGDYTSWSSGGYFGPWNPEPREHETGFPTQVGDVAEVGTIGVDVPLIAQIGE